MKLNAKFIRSYSTDSKKNPGTRVNVFVYEVNGSESDMAEYEHVQGEKFRRDEVTGKVLYFTTEGFGPQGTLIQTQKSKKIIPDMSELNMMASLAKRFGGNLGEAMALVAAQKLYGHSIKLDNVPEPKEIDADALDS